ncbi:hypothetical protein JVU11DRAFT_10114 [Chiua virens]|nr:hypothetical protein JVU11DRAFT_11529 [Chiua virens]KAG9309740.1 hypothetical protein JVU11DRAFT_10114 [Chiua virens]
MSGHSPHRSRKTQMYPQSMSLSFSSVSCHLPPCTPTLLHPWITLITITHALHLYVHFLLPTSFYSPWPFLSPFASFLCSWPVLTVSLPSDSPPREMSPSPRDRQRTVKAQSMPIVPSVMQVFNAANVQPNQRPPQQSPPSSNISLQSKRSTTPPLTQPSSKLPSPPIPPSLSREDVQEHYTPPALPIHSVTQPNIHQPPQQPPPLPHSHSQPSIHSHVPMNPTMGYPRPINRITPQFLASFHAMEENFQMTDELMAEIERADYVQALNQHPAAPGTSGVAYAGGAQSGAVYIREAPSPHKDSVLDRVRAGEHSVTRDGDSPQNVGGPTSRRPTRVNDRDRERDPQPSESAQARNRPLPASPGNSPSYSPQGHSQARGPSPDRVSPPYHTPQGSSGESGPAGDYVSQKRDSYQSSNGSHVRVPTPPTSRRSSNATNTESTRATPPAASKLASQTPPVQAMKTRTPDKSLPVQEEPEDDVAASSKDSPGHLQYDHGGNTPREDDDDTLIETETGYMRPGNDNDRDGDSGSYTPRSPSVALPETYPTRHYISSHPNNRLASLTKHHRNGSTDQLGLRSVDAVVNPKPQARPSEESQDTLRRQQGRSFNDSRDDRSHRAEQSPIQGPNQQNIRPHPLQTQVFREDHYYDDAAAAYLQTYFHSTRPNAPIPPTPHSQTAAPSPSPFVSSIQPSPAPPVGSPYPYPFTHVHRNTYPVHAVPTAPTSAYDPNHPSVIEEQLALQMQMYALNNNAAMSDSTFSPSSTPFPGTGYNPWAFLQASRAFGGRRFDSMSLQSSPSHQPVSLPFPTSRGRGLKRREKSTNLRTPGSGAKQKVVKPPPRVESTQPRDTSPEPYSSGEETAGEGYEVHEEAAWANGDDGEDAEWVDEEGDKDELLDLEYHPSFISSMEKRQRKWDTRWETLQQAFQALDCETDTTMILLAAPSHSTRLHALTSRSVRRDQLVRSPAMMQMRSAFRGIATRRQATRSRTATASILERLINSSVSGDGSDTSSETREGDLKRALETTLRSLETLRTIYDHRVSRWEEEMSRISDEREKVELLLRQTLGVSLQPNGTHVGF